jgi:hypothetical protein
VDNIKMDLDGMDWIDLAEDTDKWRALCEHGNESSGTIKCWKVTPLLCNYLITVARNFLMYFLEPKTLSL